MEINQVNNEKNGYFEAIENNVQAGKMSYVWAGETKIIIDHTEVNPEFSGKGIGKQLLMAVVENARENKIKILPLCPFAKGVFDKDETIRDVLF
ncbi:GNAT family N-acetyltransferase [Pedobacter sp. MC2016-05]|uniref:GNAT family N-acetyltransferase n=1 Tax=Pedobacter sp. MC2016-05 TaxID=2994474 RepID=UPI0022469D5C|nr:GNAT family N-acetyltransferase [Pedobacter sp. MC2016-05]MCX2474248.1 GNAT family N-acetyltransferase [Pedobacter sp. MC2016-05]